MENELRDRLRSALGQAEGLPEQDVASIGVLIDAGELALALDTLCTQIFEYDVEATSGFRDALHALGSVLDVNTDYLLGDPWADERGRCGSPEE